MPLKIFTTGLDQYAPGGNARVKVLVIGGPGVGKTRWSSYFPKPIYLDCEGGLASVADRKVAFTPIRNSQDMLDALTYLKSECPPSKPWANRQYQTVIVDTLDAFQRKVKDEWLGAHPTESSFGGFEAWNYLDARMQMLSTRLLNLDMNVIVAVHYQSKTVSEDIGGTKVEREQIGLQLQGGFKDQVFNDFDLIGWLGTYFEKDPDANRRIQKRGITFKPTVDKPFLKDRLHVTPEWMEIRFSDDDYADLFSAVTSRLDDFEQSTEVGEIPSGTGEGGSLYQEPTKAPPLLGGGVLPTAPTKQPQPAAVPVGEGEDVPLVALDKPTLMRMARERGLEFRGNTLKAELIHLIQNHDMAAAAAPAAPADAAAPVSRAAETPAPQATTPPAAQATEASDASQEPAVEDVADLAKQTLSGFKKARAPESDDSDDRPAVLTAAASPAPADTVQTAEVGVVDRRTGEVLAPAPTHDEAVTAAVQELGGQVISDTGEVEAPAVPRVAVPKDDRDGCNGICMEASCDKPIGPNPNFITLSHIKTRRHLCDDHYLVVKADGKDAITYKNS